MAKASKQGLNDREELIAALNLIEKEKNIPKEILIDAIRSSLQTACKQHFGVGENVEVDMNPETCEYHIYILKEVKEEVEDPTSEISVADARMYDDTMMIGDTFREEVKSKEFGRIATQNAKNVILQRIREEERNIIVDFFRDKEKTIVTGIVQRNIGNNVSINLGRADAILSRNEMIRDEHFKPTDRVRVYVVEVKSTAKGPKILVSRTHPDFVRCLFEEEVSEIRDGIVEIKNISREPGSRTKMAVWSNDMDVDPVGACVGMNGARVNAVVDELGGEKIDIINWDENAAILIQNALSPAKVISVIADEDNREARVVVPDGQLSLAIGKEGQNARLAARLTGFKIDIKSETQARESGEFVEYDEDYEEYEEYDEFEEYEEYADEEFYDEEFSEENEAADSVLNGSEEEEAVEYEEDLSKEDLSEEDLPEEESEPSDAPDDGKEAADLTDTQE